MFYMHAWYGNERDSWWECTYVQIGVLAVWRGLLDESLRGGRVFSGLVREYLG